LSGKIALEEHFDFAETQGSSYASLGTPEFQRQIRDLGSERLAEMDRGGVEVCIVSLVGPGIQAISDPRRAVETARHANDHLAENISKNAKRLQGFAALPLQDPHAAAEELTRCIKELGFCGALVNGFTQTGDAHRPLITTCRNIGIFGRPSNSLTCRFISTLERPCPLTNLRIKATHG
jgi:gamma-resorcylate decarboxylase